MINPAPITLAELVAEGVATSVDALAAHLDGSVFIDDIGRRVVPREVAASVMAVHAERKRAEREHRERERAARSRQPDRALQDRERVRRIKAAQNTGALHLDGLSLAESALAVITSEHLAQRLDKAGTMLDELMTRDSAMTYHPLER